MSRDTQLPQFASKLVRSLLRRRALNQNVLAPNDLRAGRGVVISSPHGLVIGRNVAVGPYTTIQVDGSIGDFTLIGMHVQICGRHDHMTGEIGTPIRESTWVEDRAQHPEDVVHIGMDVWIGGHATILGGVSIGDGAVIGAASVVTHDVEPFTIVAGVPARRIRRRFPQDEDEFLHLKLLKERAEAERLRN